MRYGSAGSFAHKPFNRILAADLDTLSLDLFDAWSQHNMTDNEYETAMDSLATEANSCPIIWQNLSRRLDYGYGRGRSGGEFALQVGRQALPEVRDTKRWAASHLGTDTYDLRYHGMAGNGAVIFSPDRVFGDPDWQLEVRGSSLLPDGVHLVETKHDPSLQKMSFKVQDLERYHRAGAYMLVFFGAYKSPDALLKWDLLEPERIARLLALPVGMYEEFGGRKPAVRLTGAAMQNFLNLRLL